jgi:hypothetical protein
MMIGKINRNAKGAKERLMVTLEDVKGTQMVNLGIYKIINDGELSPTGENVTFTPDKIELVINLLREAQRKTA